MSSTPTQPQNGDPIPFLSSEHIKLLEFVIQEAKRHITEYANANYAIYWAMPKKDQTNFRRAVYIGKLNEVFNGQDGVVIRNDKGGFYLLFDDTGLLHVKKLNRKTLLAWIPRALLRDRHHQQLPLPDFITAENIPLNELSCFIIGLVENKLGELEAVYLSQQEGDVVIHRIPLDISNTIPFSSVDPQDNAIPLVKFNAKKENKNTGTT